MLLGISCPLTSRRNLFTLFFFFFPEKTERARLFLRFCRIPLGFPSHLFSGSSLHESFHPGSLHHYVSWSGGSCWPKMGLGILQNLHQNPFLLQRVCGRRFYWRLGILLRQWKSENSMVGVRLEVLCWFLYAKLMLSGLCPHNVWPPLSSLLHLLFLIILVQNSWLSKV